MSHDKAVETKFKEIENWANNELAKMKPELSGGNVNYYLAEIPNPKRLTPYTAECEDIIEALGMTFAEGCAFKAIWRSCAARTIGKKKVGQDDQGLYDAHKVKYYAERMIAQRTPKDAPVKKVPTTEPTCVNQFGSWSCGYKVSGSPFQECPKTRDFCISLDNARNFNVTSPHK